MVFKKSFKFFISFLFLTVMFVEVISGLKGNNEQLVEAHSHQKRGILFYKSISTLNCYLQFIVFVYLRLPLTHNNQAAGSSGT